MKNLKLVILVLLTILSITSGLAKIMQLPQEMQFFGGAGLSARVIMLFGVIQLAGGVLLIFQKTRILGAIIVAVTFCVSTILILMAGKIAFGLFSILPILLLGFVIKAHAVAND